MTKVAQATFGAGCFWNVEEAFRRVEGVVDVKVGFMGGRTKDPTYIQVCGGKTGHAEVAHLTYDPTKVTYEKLLEKFWQMHDPTELNRQGPDVGEQYRSVIFYHTPEQKKLAEESFREVETSGMYKDSLATKIEKAKPFYAAEEYHQQYLAKRNANIC